MGESRIREHLKAAKAIRLLEREILHLPGYPLPLPALHLLAPPQGPAPRPGSYPSAPTICRRRQATQSAFALRVSVGSPQYRSFREDGGGDRP
jgi:hypothetical protein